MRNEKGDRLLIEVLESSAPQNQPVRKVACPLFPAPLEQRVRLYSIMPVEWQQSLALRQQVPSGFPEPGPKPWPLLGRA